jgi:hypothetical protein
MIVAAHQPHLIPWLGYVDKWAKCDRFILMDDVQYEEQNYQNRQRIKLADGAHWIIIPLIRGSMSDRIIDKRIENSGKGRRHHWQHRTWKTFECHYKRAPYFAQYAAELEDIFRKQTWEWLIDLQLRILELARTSLQIATPVVRASTLNPVGGKTDRLLDIFTKLGAKVYLSGDGGSTSYLDVDKLNAAGVSVMWQRFTHPTYPQCHPARGFISHLGFIDLVLNCGPESAAVLWPSAEARAGGSI